MIEYALYIAVTFNSGIVQTKLDSYYSNEVECQTKAKDITDNELDRAIAYCDSIHNYWWPSRKDVTFCELIDAVNTVEAHCEEITK